MTKTYQRPDLTIDQRLAIKTAAANLRAEFAETFGVETIERFLHPSYDEFVGRATVTNYLPLLAERFARQRLRALAKVEGLSTDERATVLFLCTHNAGRSQMAAALLTHHAAGAVTVRSAGSAPAETINPAVRQVMDEIGIDLSREIPKKLTTDAVDAADVVITMGCGDACPAFPGKRYLDWELTDPAGKTPEQIRPIRDDIDARVRALLTELVPATTN